MIGYAVAMILVVAYALAFRVPGLLFVPPFSWTLWGVKKYATLAFVATLVFTTPLSRVPQARSRNAIAVLTAVIVIFRCIWPFLAPMVDRKELARLRTKMDPDGICLQTTAYTCGPASAVTVLRRLQLPADEGHLAIISCTSNQEGTSVDMLASGLKRAYGKEGLAVHCRAFKNISELKDAGLTLAVIKYSMLEDHWVAVLEVTDSEVVVGDPLQGMTRLSYDDFERKWRFMGIVLRRELPTSL
jgi:predicted double-glycine peptidase